MGSLAPYIRTLIYLWLGCISAISCTQINNTPETCCISISDAPLSPLGYSGTSRCVFKLNIQNWQKSQKTSISEFLRKKVCLSHCSYTKWHIGRNGYCGQHELSPESHCQVTTDEWVSYQDMTTSYRGRTRVPIDLHLTLKSKRKQLSTFAICCNINSTEYWDNNNGNNYILLSCRVTFLNLMPYSYTV